MNITRDIAMILRCTNEKAEVLKKTIGYAVPSAVGRDERFAMPDSIVGLKDVSRCRYELAEIIEARIEDIFLEVGRHIEQSGLRGRLGVGAVLIGGTALLPGIEAVAKRMLGLPCRLGVPEGVEGMDRPGPEWATALGLLQWAGGQR